MHVSKSIPKLKFTILLVLIIISNSIVGCLSSNDEELEQFPSFNLVDEQGNQQNIVKTHHLFMPLGAHIVSQYWA